MIDPTTDELIERWIRGETAAGQKLCERYLHRARSFAQRIAGRELDPDELASEALEEGLEGLRGGLRPERFTLWLQGVVRNLSRRKFRDRRRLLPVESPVEAAGSGSALTQLANWELVRLMDEAVPKLPTGMREVVELFRQGRSREEIASRLGLDLDAVHARFLRAFKALRQDLSRHFTTMAVAARRDPVSWEEIRNLRPSFREAIVVRHLEGRAPGEAAERLGVPQDTLHARLRTAYEQLGCNGRSDFGEAREAWKRESSGV